MNIKNVVNLSDWQDWHTEVRSNSFAVMKRIGDGAVELSIRIDQSKEDGSKWLVSHDKNCTFVEFCGPWQHGPYKSLEDAYAKVRSIATAHSK